MDQLYEDFNKHLGKSNYLSASVFPMLGVNKDYFKLINLNTVNKDVFDVEHELNIRKIREGNPFSKSDYTNDICITTHPRFETFTAHCRERTGNKPNVLIPIFKDEFTDSSVVDEKHKGFIHLDSFTSGMGNGCFQVTFGLDRLEAAIYCHDQLIPILPLLVALTASSPIVKGKLSGWDNRFNILTQACDDRTNEERDPQSESFIYKSRYANVYSYISDHEYIQEFHNDSPKMPIDKEYMARLLQAGFPRRFSEYICNLFVREPMIIFEKKVELADEKDPTHFLSFMSTNWNSLRFKPALSKDGDNFYKIEVRPCDLQITAFENAAITTFIILYSRIVLNYDVNFIIPMSQNDINFNNAHINDYVNQGKFFWRTNGIKENYKTTIIKNSNYKKNGDLDSSYINQSSDSQHIQQLSLAQILGGTEDYKGLIPLMKEYVNENYDKDSHKTLNQHLDFLMARSEGKLMTDAQYIRSLVLRHPKYKKDSVVSQEIAYDVVNRILKVQNGELYPSELFGDGY